MSPNFITGLPNATPTTPGATSGKLAGKRASLDELTALESPPKRQQTQSSSSASGIESPHSNHMAQVEYSKPQTTLRRTLAYSQDLNKLCGDLECVILDGELEALNRRASDHSPTSFY